MDTVILNGKVYSVHGDGKDTAVAIATPRNVITMPIPFGAIDMNAMMDPGDAGPTSPAPVIV